MVQTDKQILLLYYKDLLIYRKNNNGDIELLKNELNLRVEEVDRQRKEMAAMADRWTDEVKSIHATHQQEKKELAEVSFMYLEAQLIYNL